MINIFFQPDYMTPWIFMTSSTGRVRVFHFFSFSLKFCPFKIMFYFSLETKSLSDCRENWKFIHPLEISISGCASLTKKKVPTYIITKTFPRTNRSVTCGQQWPSRWTCSCRPRRRASSTSSSRLSPLRSVTTSYFDLISYTNEARRNNFDKK